MFSEIVDAWSAAHQYHHWAVGYRDADQKLVIICKSCDATIAVTVAS